MSNGERIVYVPSCFALCCLIVMFSLAFMTHKERMKAPCACTPLTSVPIAVGKIDGYGHVEVFQTDTGARYMFPISNTKITIYEEAAK